MTNFEKYNLLFINNLNVAEDKLTGLKYQETELWDSVGHMALTADIEETFDIMFETDDIIDFSSYEKGIEILQRKYDIEF